MTRKLDLRLDLDLAYADDLRFAVIAKPRHAVSQYKVCTAKSAAAKRERAVRWLNVGLGIIVCMQREQKSLGRCTSLPEG
jgi:hypothetical protein